ncbi:MAG: glycosyltransferase family 2 protein [Neorhizobium sp.]|nr:glycosyltransferase family 2 protein [Neorhizobium sp.]
MSSDWGGIGETAAQEPLFNAEALAKDELAALRALGFSRPLLTRLSGLAKRNGTTIEAELLASGVVQEDAYYGAIARLLRLPFLSEIEPSMVPDMLALDAQLLRPASLRIVNRHAAPQVAIVPEAHQLAQLAAVLATMPLAGRDLVITTKSAIRSAVWQAGAARRATAVTNRLFETQPQFSARIVLSGEQGFYLGVAITGLISAGLTWPQDVIFFLHVLLSLLYFATLMLRIAALASRRRKKHLSPLPSSEPFLEPEPMPLPPYTVLVALYHEEQMARQLVASLLRLDWPASLLDIKLVCEADDEDTIAALKACRLPAHIEIVEVPPIGPRTKPKALTYALSAARGQLLAIYDAEDRPHPSQLREAWQHFAQAPPTLACLQAPLIITNARQSFLSALFSLEYSGLFRGLLPLLGRTRMPLPLGGTSNHFRVEALRQAGGWDPHNVTEDADIGLRLYRLGYHADILTRQTLEDAPVTIPVWAAQRSRWFKGWLQTWLVAMRKPATLFGEMGAAAFFNFQLLIGGMLLSSLMHPLIVILLTIEVRAMMEPPADGLPLPTLVLFAIDLANILGSYLVFVALGLKAMTEHERKLVGRRWAYMPLYWLLISYAAWRAVIELRTKPFHWNKTPHRPSGKTGAEIMDDVREKDWSG